MRLKAFGLAALAAVAAMAFVGVTSAAATELEEVVLCKSHEDPCEEGNHFPEGTVLHGVATNPELLGSTGLNVVCEKSNVLGNTSTLLAHGLITALSWTNCEESEGEECVVTTNNLPYLMKGELQSNHEKYEALVTKHAEGAGRPSARIAGCAPLDCSYGKETVLFEALLDELGTVLDVLEKLTGEGGFCVFTSGIWHAEYRIHCLEEGVNQPCWMAMKAEELE